MKIPYYAIHNYLFFVSTVEISNPQYLKYVSNSHTQMSSSLKRCTSYTKYEIRKRNPEPKSCALLVIDVQNHFSSMATPILHNLNTTISLCRHRRRHGGGPAHGSSDLVVDPQRRVNISFDLPLDVSGCNLNLLME